MDSGVLKRYFGTTPVLAALCTQNGWPDEDTVKVEVLECTGDRVICTVAFEEIVMEGAGCIAGRVPCWGRFHVELDAKDQVIHAELER